MPLYNFGTGGGNTIYTADDSISDLNRIVTLAGSSNLSSVQFNSLAGTKLFEIKGDAETNFIGSVQNVQISKEGYFNSHGKSGVTSNLFLGTNSGGSTNGGDSFNTSVGVESGANISTGDYNALFGYNAGTLIAAGSQNAVFGAYSLDAGNTSNNAAFGYASGSALTTGSDGNVLIGRLACYTNTSLDDGVFIGHQVTGTNASINEIAIGKSASGKGSNTAVWGNTSNTENWFHGSLIIQDGITAPSSTTSYAKIYVDSADGDLKIIFGDGTVKTIVTDS